MITAHRVAWGLLLGIALFIAVLGWIASHPSACQIRMAENDPAPLRVGEKDPCAD